VERYIVQTRQKKYKEFSIEAKHFLHRQALLYIRCKFFSKQATACWLQDWWCVKLR